MAPGKTDWRKEMKHNVSFRLSWADMQWLQRFAATKSTITMAETLRKDLALLRHLFEAAKSQPSTPIKEAIQVGCRVVGIKLDQESEEKDTNTC